MNISKQLQFFFKIFFQNIFFLIYGRVIYKKNTRITKNPKIIKIDSKKYHVAKVKNGRIYTDYLENVSIIDNNNVLVNNVSHQQIDGAMFPAKLNSALVKGTPRLKKKLKVLFYVWFKELVLKLITFTGCLIFCLELN